MFIYMISKTLQFKNINEIYIYIYIYLLYSYQKEALFDVKTKVYAYHIFSSNCNVFENGCIYDH